MKASKALKRLAKIDALMSAVTERFSKSAPHMREVLQEAKAAVSRAKEAVSLQASSGKAKKPPVKHSKPASKATPEPPKPKRRISEEGMKRIIAATKKRWRLQKAQAAKAHPAPGKIAGTKKPSAEKAAVKVAAAKATKKAAPVKKAAAKKAPAAAPAVTKAPAQ